MNPPDELKLYNWVRAIRGQPFQWGQLDCHILVLTWLKLLSGQDYLDRIVGRYSSEAQARAFAASEPAGLAALLIDEAGCVCRGRRASVGDIILVTSPEVPWPLSHVTLYGQALSVMPDDVVRLWPLRAIPKEREVYRWPAPASS